MPAIQVVLFDLGGTLLHYEQPPDNTFDAINDRSIRAFLAAAEQAGTRVPDVEVAVRAVGRMAAAMQAKADRAQHANTAENVVREGLEAVDIKLSQKAWNAGIRAYYSTISDTVTLASPDVRPVLAQLTDQGRQLGLVSNTLWPPDMHDEDLARFGLLEFLPVRVYSSTTGVVKPHPTIYRQALDRLDVAPAEAVFVGDKLAVDIAGPQKIGMRAILLASPFRVEEDPAVQPDARIQTLSELPGLLCAWDRAIESQLPIGSMPDANEGCDTPA